jgi:putative transposase
VNAILYRQKTGCRWRRLPHDFPKWQTVYGIFHQCKLAGAWWKIHATLVKIVRRRAGKKTRPSIGIVDSQSVKTSSTGGETGFDGAKKINGRKRYIVVDTLGLIQSVAVTPADTSEDSGACLVLHEAYENNKRLNLVFADSAYKRNGLPAWIETTLGIKVQPVLRPVAMKGFQVLPKQWTVERTFGWFNNDRRLSKDYERTEESAVAMIQIGQIRRMLNRLENIH